MEELRYHESKSPFYEGKSVNNGYLSGSDELPLIRFRCFDEIPWMDAVMTTRIGGVSKEHLSSLNLGDDRGDKPENVMENYRLVAESLGVDFYHLVKTDQVHDTKVFEVDESHIPAGPKVRKFPKTDGLYTNLPNVAICIGGADCVPIFLAGTGTKTVAGVHSGWRGTVGRIGAKAVKLLTEKGERPEDIIALIGPSISQECYEVTGDVVEEFKNAGFSEAWMADIAYKTDHIHYQLDLWAACYYYLKDAGIPEENIHFSGICTYENPSYLYSHRYTGGLRGNQNGIIFIKEQAK